MPWTCGACAFDVPEDVPRCPSCDAAKTSWSVVAGRTCRLVVGTAARFECLRGASREPLPSAGALRDVAWAPTDALSALRKETARALARAGQLPAPRDLMLVRLVPRRVTDLAVELTPLVEHGLPEPRTVRPAPADPGAAVDVPVVGVFGAGEGIEEIAFPGVHVLDLTDGAGWAPRLEVAALRRPRRALTVEGPPPARWEGVARRGVEARMVVEHPHVVAGRPCVFEVTQEGFGPVGRVEAIAEAGRCTAAWRDWFAPERVTARADLGLAEGWPPVRFVFRVTGEGLDVAGPPIAYADTFHARLVQAPDERPIRDLEVTLHTAWGTTRARSDADGVVCVRGLPPGGVRRLALPGGAVVPEEQAS